MKKAKNLTLVFNDFEEVHLGKDVFLTPYYIAKEYNLQLDVVFPNTLTNQNLPIKHRGANLIRENFLYKKRFKFLRRLGLIKEFSLIREFNFFKYIFKNSKNIDYLMLFHLSKKTMLQAILYKKINPKGKVYIKSDINFKGLKKKQDYKTYRLKWKVARLCTRSFIKYVDLISVETSDVYEKIKSDGLYGYDVKDKIELIYNGFDDVLFDTLNIKILPFHEKENMMITVGRIGARVKNNEMLLNAIDQVDIKDWKVALIGPVTAEFRKKYKSFIYNNPDKRDKVILVGNIGSKEELFDYYNRAKVFLFTSLSESFGLVLTEALRFGDYIVSTDVGAAADVTNKSKNGQLIPVKDTRKLGNEINKIINNEIDLERKYKESIELSQNNFLWSTIIGNSIKIKQKFIGEL